MSWSQNSQWSSLRSDGNSCIRVLTGWRKWEPQGSTMAACLYLIPFPNPWNLVPLSRRVLPDLSLESLQERASAQHVPSWETMQNYIRKEDSVIFPTNWAGTLAWLGCRQRQPTWRGEGTTAYQRQTRSSKSRVDSCKPRVQPWGQAKQETKRKEVGRYQMKTMQHQQSSLGTSHTGSCFFSQREVTQAKPAGGPRTQGVYSSPLEADSHLGLKVTITSAAGFLLACLFLF